MTEEDAFLQALLANPDDVNLRLVYADWLEERGDPRGELLRLDVKLVELPPKGVPARKLRRRLEELRQGIDPTWLARIDSTPIDGCVAFAFECPKRWEHLRPTKDPLTRYCTSCRKHVHHCHTLAEAQDRADRRECVALDSRLLRTPNDLRFPPPRASQFRMGRFVGRLPLLPQPHSDPAPTQPPPDDARFRPRQRVVILEGDLAGTRGKIKSIDLDRQTATVSLVHKGQRRTVELDFEALVAAGGKRR
jgi:uncharacterized protein (TIGR02996 family)